MIGFAIDMDGTVYKGDNPIPGAKEFIAELRKRGIPFRFLTNNSSHTRGFFAARLKRLGFDVTDDDVLSSTLATTRFIADKRKGKTVRVIATPDVCKEIEVSGIQMCQTGQPDIVLLTFDTTIDYAKINDGYHCMLAGSELIATHPDDVCPTEDSYDVDIGPFIRLYESLTGKDATVIGKPNRLMLEMAGAEMGIPPEDVVMIGDRLSTDIRMAELAGTRSILVLSGETDRAIFESSDSRPTFVLDSVADIVPQLLDTGRLRPSVL
ncbi:putative sugar phosphatases of the HAD superfamily [Thermoplasmatales archaeon BRNA1]|nr:putative sugar phosphatases of the HAD superfamily [Thermoplasmatales archaeon BRNA1]